MKFLNSEILPEKGSGGAIFGSRRVFGRTVRTGGRSACSAGKSSESAECPEEVELLLFSSASRRRFMRERRAKRSAGVGWWGSESLSGESGVGSGAFLVLLARVSIPDAGQWEKRVKVGWTVEFQLLSFQNVRTIALDTIGLVWDAERDSQGRGGVEY